MNSAIEILLLEDDPNDAGLVEERLQADHFIPRITRVQDRTEFLAALENGEFDLILSDHKLPSFDGLSALNLALSIRPDIPFIFVSGTLGEEAAIEALKVGAAMAAVYFALREQRHQADGFRKERQWSSPQ
jgi:CheY-like chemotaxis protein